MKLAGWPLRRGGDSLDPRGKWGQPPSKQHVRQCPARFIGDAKGVFQRRKNTHSLTQLHPKHMCRVLQGSISWCQKIRVLDHLGAVPSVSGRRRPRTKKPSCRTNSFWSPHRSPGQVKGQTTFGQQSKYFKQDRWV